MVMYGYFKATRWILAALAVLLVLVSVLRVEKGRAGSGVDLLLVIALDVSASVNGREYQLMTQGLSNALASPMVAQAVSAGNHGAIGVSVLQWSGFKEQDVKIEWRRVANGAELKRLAHEVSQMRRHYDDGATDIGGAINFSTKLIQSAPFQAARRVIDIVGDGPNNVNYSPDRERDKTIKQGMVINALVITGGIEILPGYFRQFVIGGKGAFVEETNDFDGFERAIRRKLLREIGNLYLF
jgi:hypothetical protein